MITSILLFLLYLVWGLFSFLTQGNDRLRKKFKAADPLGLIPNYRFFCPNPIRTDYHLYYRIRHPNTQVSEWTEIIVGRRSPYIGFLWNPLKRDRKILYKTAKLLRNQHKKGGEEPTYLAMIDWIRATYAQEPEHAVQFRITSRQDLSPKSVEKEIHVSAFHSLKPQYAPALSI
jgi:hypothetical protein